MEHLINQRLKMSQQELLTEIEEDSVKAAFFDPQYRGVLDHLDYGNEGESRGKERSSLPQMSDMEIKDTMDEIFYVLVPSGHIFLWLDKYHLCTNFKQWLGGTGLPAAKEVVDLIVWDKQAIGMGYRTRRKCEYLLVIQKPPQKAKEVWTRHDIPDVWSEKLPRMKERRQPGGLILRPKAGSWLWAANRYVD